MNKEALYYQKEENTIKCKLCPHRCAIQEGKSGACRVRVAKKDENGELRLYSTNYGEITSIALDPIEKKPLNQFYPQSRILSIGTFGCNFKCPYCQNHRISQDKPETKFVSAKDMAIISKEIIDNIGLAFTYNEPIIWYEYVLDVCKNIKKINPEQKTVLVTNGYINEEPFRELLPYIDAINIDLKGGKDFYNKLCKGELEEVENAIRIAYSMKCHLEITTLLVPGENTDYPSLNYIGQFISSIDKDIPLHLARYIPSYKMDRKTTALEEIRTSYKLLKSYLNNIYLQDLNEAEYDFCKAK